MITVAAWFQLEPAEFCRALGLLGFLLYVLNYTSLSLRFVTSEHLTYFVVNVTAASLVLISLTSEFNLASALIQCFWILIGSVGIALRLRRRREQVSGRPEVARL